MSKCGSSGCSCYNSTELVKAEPSQFELRDALCELEMETSLLSQEIELMFSNLFPVRVCDDPEQKVVQVQASISENRRNREFDTDQRKRALSFFFASSEPGTELGQRIFHDKMELAGIYSDILTLMDEVRI